MQKFSRLFTFQMQRFKGYRTRLANEIEFFENIKILIVEARIYFYSCILVILNTVHQLFTFCSRILGIYSIKLYKQTSLEFKQFVALEYCNSR